MEASLRARVHALGIETMVDIQGPTNAAATAMLESFHVDIANGAVWLGNRRVLVVQAQSPCWHAAMIPFKPALCGAPFRSGQLAFWSSLHA